MIPEFSAVRPRPLEETKINENPLKEKDFKKKGKIDVRTLGLKPLIDIMTEKKITKINLNYSLFPSLIANEQNFANNFNQDNLSQAIFDPCMITPYDQRMMATILV